MAHSRTRRDSKSRTETVDVATDGRSTRWDEHRAQRQGELLDAAVSLIEAEGPRFRVGRLAEHAGLPRSVLYRHFKDRAGLERLIRRRVVDAFMRQLEPTMRFEGTVAESTRQVINAYLDWVVSHPSLYAYVGVGTHSLSDGSVVADAKTAIARTLADRFREVLDSIGVHDAPIMPIATGLVGFVDATVNQWVADGQEATSEGELREILVLAAEAILESGLAYLGVRIPPDQPLKDLLVP
ncbi:TetR/AcrR family transcriptional regulator [Streptomyces polyrhachis]|uniref:TetR/AcrR family transcriptional regulator n=1 Tax=Streptomyces polyrhachis TaxID=1282885 RepID=A0ABW2GEB8_9ACTN